MALAGDAQNENEAWESGTTIEAQKSTIALLRGGWISFLIPVGGHHRVACCNAVCYVYHCISQPGS